MPTRRTVTHFLDGIGVSLTRLRPIALSRGRFGRIRLYRHPELGKVFLLGNEIQHVEAWAPLYHEALVHLPATFIGKVRNVLILGGGTLYAAAEALKYASVQKVVVVDHDPSVTRLVVKHYAHAKRCVTDPRFTLIDGDAYSFLSDLNERFDLIINDGADLLAVERHAQRGRSSVFIAMTQALAPGGVCADVVYRHLFERTKTLHTIKLLRTRFSLALSLVFLPEYHGVLHVLLIWGRKNSSISQQLKRPLNKAQLDWTRNPERSPCSYYNPRFLRYFLYLPRYVSFGPYPQRKSCLKLSAGSGQAMSSK